MHDEAIEVEARGRQQVNMHVADLDAALQRRSNGVLNARPQVPRARPDDEQGKDHGAGGKDPPAFGSQLHLTNRKVRRQRVSSKK